MLIITFELHDCERGRRGAAILQFGDHALLSRRIARHSKNAKAYLDNAAQQGIIS